MQRGSRCGWHVTAPLAKFEASGAYRRFEAPMAAGKSSKDNGKSPAAAKSGDEKPKSGDEKLTPAQIKAAKAGGKKGGKRGRQEGTSSTGSSSGLVLPALAVVAAAVGVGVYLRSQPPPPPPARRNTAAAAAAARPAATAPR